MHKLLLLYLFSTACLKLTNGTHNESVLNATAEATLDRNSTWLHNLKFLRQGVQTCLKQAKSTTWDCLKSRTIKIFEEIISSNVIPIWEGVRLVKRSNGNSNFPKTPTGSFQDHNEGESSNDNRQRKDLKYLTWFDHMAMILTKTLNTHLLQINLKELADAYAKAMDKIEAQSQLNKTDSNGTARFRRHRNNMIITMMFGVTALGAVLVPMGFQLLSVVSGKALLLAKMALLLASINGLKRVANSGVHYGLYQVPGEHYGYYDRGDHHHPRNVPSLPPGQVLALDLNTR